MTVNSEGTLIASASVKGTLIKIFSAEEGELLQELRRGAGKAIITSIVFHPTMNLIACTSNRTSIHLFEIKKSIEKCIENKQYGFNQTNSTIMNGGGNGGVGNANSNPNNTTMNAGEKSMLEGENKKSKF